MVIHPDFSLKILRHDCHEVFFLFQGGFERCEKLPLPQEVFKLREMEITAELVGSASPKTRTKSKSKKSSDGANVAGSLVGSEKSEKKPINLPPEKVHIRSIESSEASSDSEVDCPLRPEVSEVSASESELEERESMWLKLSPLNTFITSYVSKALGLIPLFDPLCTDMEVASKGSKGWLVPCLKQVVSRIYHWSLGRQSRTK